MDQPLVLWIGGIVFAVIGMLLKTTLDRILKTQDDQGVILGKQGMTLAKIDATLHGDNGLASEVRQLRTKAHDQGQQIHVVDGKATVLTIRVEQLEEAEERRSGQDRRALERGDERRQA